MEEINDLTKGNSTEAMVAKKGGSPVSEDVVLQDYVMLDFVEDFGELGKQNTAGSDPA